MFLASSSRFFLRVKVLASFSYLGLNGVLFWIAFNWPPDALQSYGFNIFVGTDIYADTHTHVHVAVLVAGTHWIKFYNSDNTKPAQHALAVGTIKDWQLVLD